MEINKAIQNYILNNTDPEVINLQRATWMADHLTKFVVDAVEKFAIGQAEHNSEIENCDLKRELRQEVMDSFWYISALQKPLKK